jgi:cystathionine beta-lyase
MAVRWVQGAARSFAFASGMAALSAVLRLVKAGEHVVAGDDLYGGTSRLLAQVAPGLGIDVTNVNTADIECVTAPDLFDVLILSLFFL